MQGIAGNLTRSLAHDIVGGALPAVGAKSLQPPDALLFFTVRPFKGLVEHAGVALKAAIDLHHEASGHFTRAVCHHAPAGGLPLEILGEVQRGLLLRVALYGGPSTALKANHGGRGRQQCNSFEHHGLVSSRRNIRRAASLSPQGSAAYARGRARLWPVPGV